LFTLVPSHNLTEECENLEKSQDRRNNAKKCKITDVESEKEFVFPAFEFCGLHISENYHFLQRPGLEQQIRD